MAAWVEMTLRRTQNIFMLKDIKSFTTILTLNGIEKVMQVWELLACQNLPFLAHKMHHITRKSDNNIPFLSFSVNINLKKLAVVNITRILLHCKEIKYGVC